MILSIRLKNIALIKSAEIDFSRGLNVLSGETGAGKTVIINAINFVLGAKADKTMIRFGETVAEAEVSFAIDSAGECAELLNEYGIEFDGELVVRRRINVDGRSDVKVNGISVTLAMLKKLTNTLTDVYGQSEHYSLLDSGNQLKVLDGFIGEEILSLKNKAQPLILEIKKATKTLEETGGDERSRAVRMDVLKYQLNEIDKAELYEGEEDELIEKRALLQNSVKIGEALSLSSNAIYGDGGASDILSTALSKLNQITNFSEDYSTLYDRLYSLKVEADDIARDADDFLSNIDFDEEEKARVEDRLDLIKSLKRKYGNSYEEIMEFYSKSLEEYENLQNFEELSKTLENVIITSKTSLNKIYEEMFNVRVKHAKTLSLAVEKELATLGMKNARFNIDVAKTDKDVLSVNGNNEVTFTFSANAGEPLKVMSKIISGGEMSRFMLALKIVSSSTHSTYIFDEIDAGISGDVALIVAQKFIELSKKAQVITISHLPQMVTYADHNYLIKKFDDGESTFTNVLSLDNDGKINEIMRIVGGDKETAKSYAFQSVELANNYKKSI